MSLDYDLTAVDPQFWKEGEASENEWQVTHSLIWATWAIDMGSITEANAEEFAERLAAVQRLRGAFLQRVVDGKLVDRPLTLEDVRRRIGLKTNVTTTSKAKFKNKIAREVMEAAGREVRS